MATTKDYIEYVCERLHGAGGLRYRKMFGEYMVYVNDKPVLLVCDNTVFVKIVPELAALMAPYFDVDIVISDDRMYQVCGTKK